MKAATERLVWQSATVTRIVDETRRVKSYFLDPPQWRGFKAGQHVDVRLTAPDGYQAQRSYSIGSAPGAPEVELVIEKLDEGEVSPFFHDIVHTGDTIELRGPIGGHFTWGAKDGGPVLLVGGGSGVVPLMSILRHRADVAPEVPMVLVYSARRLDEVIFMKELFSRSAEEENFHLILTLSREESADPRVRFGRIDAGLFAGVLARFNMVPRHTYVCGSSGFVDAASRLLIDGGVDFMSIKTERYGGDPAREIVVPEAAPPTA